MDPTVPLVVCQVNPDDLEGHEGIIANPNCSTMQLAPVLMALRDARRSRAGRRRHLPVGLRHRRRRPRRARRPDRGARRRARPQTASVYPHPIAFNALPEIDVFLPNGYTKEEWKVVNESRKILGLPDLRISCTAVRIPVFVSHSEAVHVETREPITPGASPRAVRGRPGRRRPGRPGRARLPARDRGRRPRRDLRRAGAARRLDRGRPRHRVLGRRGQPAQGRGDERRRARRGPRRARLDQPGAGQGRAPYRALGVPEATA